MSIVLLGSTSGSITLQEPAIAGSTVLDLPAVSGTILTTTSPKAGNVIQVVSATSSTANSTTSTSFVATNLTATITPTSSASKILILISGSCWVSGSNYVYTTITRGTTNLSGSSGFSGVFGNAGTSAVCMNYLDSPATTTATSYSAYFRATGGTAFFIETTNGIGTITLLEIAA